MPFIFHFPTMTCTLSPPKIEKQDILTHTHTHVASQDIAQRPLLSYLWKMTNPHSPNEVITGKHKVLRICLRQRIVAHRPSLRVVVRRVGVQVVEVLGPVLTDTQVSHGGLHLRTAETSLSCYSTLTEKKKIGEKKNILMSNIKLLYGTYKTLSTAIRSEQKNHMILTLSSYYPCRGY